MLLGIQLLVRTHGDETALEQQIAIMRELIRDQVDAIVLAPGHSTEMIPVVKEAMDAGIPVLATVNQQAEEQGYLGVKYAARVLAGETLPPETFIDVKLVTAETRGEP